MPAWISILLIAVAGTAGGEEPLGEAWSTKAEDVTGQGISLRVQGSQVLFDAFDRLGRLRVKDGRKLPAFRIRACEGRIRDLRVEAGRLLVLSEQADMRELGPMERRRPSVFCLLALDPVSGRQRWKVADAGPAPLAVARGRVFVLSDGSLQARSLASGKLLWKAEAGRAATGPVVAGDLVALQAAGAGGKLRAFSAGKGELAWSRALPGEIRCPAVAGEKQLFVSRLTGLEQGETNGCLIAIDLESGEEAWRRDFPGEMLRLEPLFAGGRLFVVAEAGPDSEEVDHLYALEASSGEIAWQKPIVTGGHEAVPLIAGRDVLVWSGRLEEFEQKAVCSRFDLLAFDGQTGDRAWAHEVPMWEKAQLGRLAVAGKGLLIYADGERIRALRKKSPAR